MLQLLWGKNSTDDGHILSRYLKGHKLDLCF